MARNKRTTESIGLELYARGYGETRAQAHALAEQEPDTAARLLAMCRDTDQGELRHPDDTADPGSWGHAGPAPT